MGRRIFKKVYSGEILEKHLSFVYDGYKLIEERNALDNNAAVRKYVWQPEALDRDVPLTVYDVVSEKTYYYHTDANKNVTELSDESGNVVAHYEYSPFGSLTKVTGDYAGSNPFRFSSEFHDDETGLVYYNYRYYSPELGRWTKRDPIEEQGGFNLYGMIKNKPLYRWDSLGYGHALWCPIGLARTTWTGIVAGADYVFDDQFPILGSVTGPVGDIGKGLGNLLMFDGSGWGQLGTGLGDLFMNQISEGVGFLYANTYGKGVGLYNSNGIGDALLTTAILNSGNYGGRNYGANTPDAQYNPFWGDDNRIENASFKPDTTLSKEGLSNKQQGQAHLDWVKNTWTGAGREPGLVGQGYRAIGTVAFGAAGLIQKHLFK